MQVSDRKAFASDSYWIGSEDSCRVFPNILYACLRRQEKYIKAFMYKDKSSVKERVSDWMARAAKKYHFPCAGHITVGTYEGHPGYNFVASFQSVEWTPDMLATSVIPSTFTKTSTLGIFLPLSVILRLQCQWASNRRRDGSASVNPLEGTADHARGGEAANRPPQGSNLRTVRQAGHLIFPSPTRSGVDG